MAWTIPSGEAYHPHHRRSTEGPIVGASVERFEAAVRDTALEYAHWMTRVGL